MTNINQEELTTLAELAKELKINKSKLNYYFKLGLIKPVKIIGKTLIFSRKEVLADLEKVEKKQEKGQTLIDIGKK